MKCTLLLAFCSVLAGSASVSADESQILGYGRLISNDFLGDGHDRWHSGSFVVSQMRGPVDLDGLPSRPGELIELRFRSEVIAPSRLTGSGPFDRPYAGVVSIGVHTYFEMGGLETSLGIDLVAVGEQTGVSALQKAIHEGLFGTDFDSFAVELDNAVYPTFLGEVSRNLEVSENLSVRPFLEAQAGIETFVRAGADLTLGQSCYAEVRIRDVTTGHRYRAIGCNSASQLTGVFGADVAWVFDSAYLPSSQGFRTTDLRGRLRAGLQYEGRRASIFYGLTWLSKEFEGQADDQITGSLNVNLRF